MTQLPTLPTLPAISFADTSPVDIQNQVVDAAGAALGAAAAGVCALSASPKRKGTATAARQGRSLNTILFVIEDFLSGARRGKSRECPHPCTHIPGCWQDHSSTMNGEQGRIGQKLTTGIQANTAFFRLRVRHGWRLPHSDMARWKAGSRFTIAVSSQLCLPFHSA